VGRVGSGPGRKFRAFKEKGGLSSRLMGEGGGGGQGSRGRQAEHDRRLGFATKKHRGLVVFRARSPALGDRQKGFARLHS